MIISLPSLLKLLFSGLKILRIFRCSLGLLLFASLLPLALAAAGCCFLGGGVVFLDGFLGGTLLFVGGFFLFVEGFAELFFFDSAGFLGAESELELVLEARVRLVFLVCTVGLGAGS